MLRTPFLFFWLWEPLQFFLSEHTLKGAIFFDPLPFFNAPSNTKTVWFNKSGLNILIFLIFAANLVRIYVSFIVCHPVCVLHLCFYLYYLLHAVISYILGPIMFYLKYLNLQTKIEFLFGFNFALIACSVWGRNADEQLWRWWWFAYSSSSE